MKYKIETEITASIYFSDEEFDFIKETMANSPDKFYANFTKQHGFIWDMDNRRKGHHPTKHHYLTRSHIRWIILGIKHNRSDIARQINRNLNTICLDIAKCLVAAKKVPTSTLEDTEQQPLKKFSDKEKQMITEATGLKWEQPSEEYLKIDRLHGVIIKDKP